MSLSPSSLYKFTGAFYNLSHFSLHLYYLPQDHHLSLSLTCGGHVANNSESEKSVPNYKISTLQQPISVAMEATAALSPPTLSPSSPFRRHPLLVDLMPSLRRPSTLVHHPDPLAPAKIPICSRR
jgi:hypothetical protein